MGIKILVYDDSEALRTSMEVLIAGEEGFDLLALMPNAETVETDIREMKPDVVLMDIDMPVVNGVEAVRKIRKTETLFDSRASGMSRIIEIPVKEE
jgi:DNA-binding NarL/FixJ family response regulator